MPVSLSAVVLIFYVTAGMHFLYTPDDTYIFLQFAKNIVHGSGFAFNAGEPTYGVTSPLWLLLVSVGGWLGIDVYMAAKILDLVLASLALLVLYVVAVEIIRDHFAALCVTLVLSVNIWFLRWAGTGMETSFSVLLILLTLRYCLKNEYFLAIVLVALLTLVRPEAWLLVVLIFVDVYINSVDKRRGRNMVLALTAIYGALLLPWFVYALMTFRTVIPNTVLAKSAIRFHLDDLAWTFTDIVKTLAVSDGVTIGVLLVGLSVLVRKRTVLIAMNSFFQAEEQTKPVSNLEYLRLHFLPLAWIFALPAMYIATNSNIVSRYLLLIVPLIILYAFALLWRVLVLWGKQHMRSTVAVVLTAVIIAQNQFVYYRYVKPSIEAFAQGMEDCFIPIGRWLHENTPEGTVVFVPDIGAIGYYSDRKICDVMGLVSPQFLPLLRRGYTLGRMMEERTYRTICQASYVVVRSHDPQKLESDDLEPLFTKMVFGLGLADASTVYYTVYKVRHRTQGE